MLLTQASRIFACLLEGESEMLNRLDRSFREFAFMREGAWEEIWRVVPDVVNTLRFCNINERLVCAQFRQN